MTLTHEQREAWRKDAEVSGPRSCPCGCWPKDNRILALLDALDAAEQKALSVGVELGREQEAAGMYLMRAERAEEQGTKLADGLHVWREQCERAESERDEAVAKVARGLALAYASDDGTEYEHNGHGFLEGEAECPGCWAADIRAALDTPATDEGGE